MCVAKLKAPQREVGQTGLSFEKADVVNVSMQESRWFKIRTKFKIEISYTKCEYFSI